jgi:hypothetical protein
VCIAACSAMGRISSAPPGVHTGNLENKDLSAGTTLSTNCSRAPRAAMRTPRRPERPWLDNEHCGVAVSPVSGKCDARHRRSVIADDSKRLDRVWHAGSLPV